MGILGYTALVNSDGGVFAHLHPSGTVSTETPIKANPKHGGRADSARIDMPGMNIHSGSLPGAMSLPCGVPAAGGYRIPGQMKHGAMVEAGAFDRRVANAFSLREPLAPSIPSSTAPPQEIRATGNGDNLSFPVRASRGNMQ